MKKKLHIIFQTHWDREWYFPFETFRGRLNLVIRRIIQGLDNDEFHSFLLDGQTLPILDYLETADDAHTQKFLRYIKEGRIIIGPWYIAMDEFLVQGESIIRNLELGHKIATQFGEPQKLGYLPDTFGHVSQMPQILKNFNIYDAVMWRGIDSNKSECIWRGADQSELFVIYLSQGYYQPLLNQDNFIDEIKQYMDKVSPLSTSGDLLLTMGGDHLMPRDINMAEKMSVIEKELKIEVVDTTFKDYIQEVKNKLHKEDLQVLNHELRNNKNAYILSNVWSSRQYLKQMNQTLEDEMIRYLEPFHALMCAKLPNLYKNNFEYIWKLILENQPHDSISGCSSDEVHQENEIRFLKAKQAIDALFLSLLDDHHIYRQSFYSKDQVNVQSDDTNQIILNANIHPFRGNLVVEANLNDQYESLQARIQGKIYDGYVESITENRVFESPLDYPPFFRKRFLHRIHLVNVKLPGLSITNLEWKPSNQKRQLQKYINSINNGSISISIEKDGTLKVEDLVQNTKYEGILKIISELDAGDTYNYSKPTFDHQSTATLHRIIQATEINDIFTLEYELSINQPSSLNDDRVAAKETLIQIILVKVTTLKDSTSIHVDLKYHNKAKDHRMKMIFPMKKIRKFYSDSAFDYIEREIRTEQFKANKLKEVDFSIDPSLSSILVKNDDHFIHYIHKALHEFQVKQDAVEDTLEVTLSRSIGYLSRDDFASRGGAAGPNLPTSEAQVLRDVHHSFDITINRLEETIESIYHQINEKRYHPRIFKGNLMNTIESFIEIEDPKIQLSSFRHINQNEIELRLWNVANHKVTIPMKTSDIVTSIIETNFLNEKKGNIRHEELIFSEKEIKTLILKIN